MALRTSISRSFPNFKYVFHFYTFPSNHVTQELKTVFRGLVFSLNSVLGPDIGGDESTLSKSASAPLSIPGETLYELQQTALKELDSLKRNFDQMEKRIERVKALPEGSRSEVLLKNSLKQVLGTFLQSHLPEFRFMSKQFLATINHPRVKETIQDWQNKKKIQEEEQQRREAEMRDREKFYELQNKGLERDGLFRPAASDALGRPTSASATSVKASSPPNVISPLPDSPAKPRQRLNSHTRSESLTDKILNFFTEETGSAPLFGSSPSSTTSKDPISISLVHPAICPVDGGVELSIRGTSFKPGIRVKIGPADVSPSCITFVDASELKVIAPAISNSGTYALQLRSTQPKFRACRSLTFSLSFQIQMARLRNWKILFSTPTIQPSFPLLPAVEKQVLQQRHRRRLRLAHLHQAPQPLSLL